ncbi:MAG: hypothetical protein E7111_05265 [Bacteroidales bacterium]|nr:hypothetical protein [Bacteroidales bacterium]
MKKTFNIILVLLISVIASYESILGLLQILGVRASGHVQFAMTGSFENPGPFGGWISIFLSILVSYLIISRGEKYRCVRFCQIVAAVSAVLCMLVLPASMSRAAWLGFGIVCLILAYTEYGLHKWVTENRKLAAIVAISVVTLLVGIFCIKWDSAIGRLHIWHMELRAICDNPLTGSGPNAILGVYGRTQAEYFAEKERCEMIVRVAGCPEYAFNEYLRIGVEYGVVAMIATILILIILLIVLIRKKSPLGYGLISLSVFAFFSYPLSVFHIESEAESVWKSTRYLSSYELYDEVVQEYDNLYNTLSDNYRFLYDYGYALHKLGQYQKSNEVLEKGSRISSDPMFYNIMGKNYEGMMQYDKAEKCYIHAHYMVPSRLYPLILLMEMHVKTDNKAKALYYGNLVLKMPVNSKLSTMQKLHERARSCVDTLNVF